MSEARDSMAPSGFAADQTHVQTIGPLLRQLHDAGFDASALAAVRRAYDMAAELWSVNFQSSGRSFLCHAVGTAGLVARHGGSPPAILAAVLHAAYNTSGFGVRIRGATRKRRRRVRDVIGVEAEALVFRFYELGNEFGTRWDGILAGGGASGLSAEDRAVLLIRICNDIDDVTDRVFSSSERQKRIDDFCHASVALAEALERPDLAELLREAYAECASAGFLSEEIQESHPSGYIVVPPAFAKRLVPGVLEVAHRLWTKGRLRP